jgi:3-mercaptopyruvate sulfurtransferase SseA
MLRTYGHENASVLNGGYTKWIAEGRRVEKTPGFESQPTSDDFNYVFKPELYRTFEQIVKLSSDIKNKNTNE